MGCYFLLQGEVGIFSDVLINKLEREKMKEERRWKEVGKGQKNEKEKEDLICSVSGINIGCKYSHCG